MPYKCKECGYVFRNDDEDICPECLTPREQSASCDQYHSHELFENQTFSYVKHKKKSKDVSKHLLFIIITIIIISLVIPLIRSVISEISMDLLKKNNFSDIKSSYSDNDMEEQDDFQVQANGLDVGESLDINKIIPIDYGNIKYSKITNLGNNINGMDFGEDANIFSVEVEISIDESEYERNGVASIYFSPYIEAYYINHNGTLDKEPNNIHSLNYSGGYLENQLVNSMQLPYNTVIKGILYFNVPNYYTNKKFCDREYVYENGKSKEVIYQIINID